MVTFQETWKVKQFAYQVRWGTANNIKADRERIEYKGEQVFDVVNDKNIRLANEKQQTIRKLVSNMSSLFYIAIIFACLQGVFYFRSEAILGKLHPVAFFEKRGVIVAAVLNAVVVKTLSII